MWWKRQLVAGIDVGTTKVCSAIAELDGKKIRLLGVGFSPSKGMKQGLVVNLSDAIESIRRSLEETEKCAGVPVESAWVSTGGAYLYGVNRPACTEVRGRNGEVSMEDVTRVLAEARSFEAPVNYEIIHELTQGFWVDGQERLLDPMGMCGSRIGVNLHLVLNAKGAVNNVVNAVNKAGVVVCGVVMQQLASGEAALTRDEKEMGVIVADIGGGTTDIALYYQGNIRLSEVLPVGGNLITSDIWTVLKTPLEKAEWLKINCGAALPDEVPEEEVIEIEEIGTGRLRAVPRRLLCQIIEARCHRLLTSVQQTVHRLGVAPELFTGLVLTGGGALLEGIVEKAGEVFDMPVRLGYPINVVDPADHFCLLPSCTALGILKYCANRRELDKLAFPTGAATRPLGLVDDMKRRVISWIG